MMLVLGMSACAHQSKITPSNGHIDGQNTAKGQTQAQMGSNSASDSKPVTANIPKPVTNNTYLPPPKPQVKAQLYNIVVYDTPVKEVLFAIARDSKLNIDIHPSIQGNVTLNAVDQTLPAILERLSKQVDLTYKIENNVLTIKPDTPFLKTYAVNYVNMSRDTTAEVSVSNEIASSASVTGGASDASNNTSKTKVVSESKNHYWDTLIENIKSILQESDKEVLIKRLVTDSTLRESYKMNDSVRASGSGSASAGGTTGLNSGSAEGASGAGNEALEATKLASKNAKNDSNATEYRKLYAASVIPNKETGVLSVRATQRQHEKVQEFLDKVQASGRRQVLIEASIVEIKLNDRFQAGVDWSRLGNGFTFEQNTSFSTPDTVVSKLPSLVVGYKSGTALGNIAASVKLLQTFGATKVLSSPKMMVLNSQTAILKAVENRVYFTITATPAVIGANGNVTAPSTVTTTPHTIPIGIWMSVTPQVNENGTVTMNVRPTISRLSDEIQDPNPDLKARDGGLKADIKSVIPQTSVREMESMLQVPSGNTVILGGLMQDEISNNNNGVPGISNVPVIGNAFKAKDNNTTKTELVIFLRPTVITNASLESDELANYKQYLPTQALERASDAEAENER